MISKKIISHFKNQDPILFDVYQKLIDSNLHQDLEVSPKDTNTFFSNLCSSIVSQQLSTKVADTIWGRFSSLLTNEIEPQRILDLSDDQLRSVGLSRAKTLYLKELARHVKEKSVSLEKMTALTPEEVIAQLTIVKGIGVWTAEMFMMFTLGREDIFSPRDLGLKNAVKKWYNLPDPITLSQLDTISEHWAPYRTHASFILWRSLELK